MHTKDKRTPNKWNTILQLHYSPLIALNRTYSLAKVMGSEIAIKEALKINFSKNHLYHVLLAELYQSIDKNKQLIHLNIALELARTKLDKRIILNKIEAVNNN